jgi:hypothetical protein
MYCLKRKLILIVLVNPVDVRKSTSFVNNRCIQRRLEEFAKKQCYSLRLMSVGL